MGRIFIPKYMDSCKHETFNRVEVTPELAKIMYARNYKLNRTLNHSNINKIAQSIKDGLWQYNGDVIRFNTKGELIDGQHRLLAIIKTGIPVVTDITVGIDEAVYLIDKNVPRSTHQSLQMAGMSAHVVNPSTVAIAKLYLTIENKQTICISDDDVKKWFNTHGSTAVKAKSMISIKGHGVNPKSASLMLALLGAIEAGEDEAKLTRFIDVFCKGFAEKKETAAIVCRNDVLDKNISYSNGASRIRAVRQFEKAIYDFCRGVNRKSSYKNWETGIYIFPNKENEAEE